jgi:hypothetical protein
VAVIDSAIIRALGNKQFSDQSIDPRAQAIEGYMREQGDDSRMPVYHPQDLVPREVVNSIPGTPDVPMSPNEFVYQSDQAADQGALLDDFVAEVLKNKQPYYGGEGVQRRFFPKR